MLKHFGLLLWFVGVYFVEIVDRAYWQLLFYQSQTAVSTFKRILIAPPDA